MWARQPVPASAPTSATDPGSRAPKKAANYVGITPSNWSSGTMNQSRRAISKEGPAPLRLAFCQASSVARTMDPSCRVLSPAHDRTRPLPHPGHYRGRQETGRKDLENPHHRTQMYELRDLEGQPVTKRAAKEITASHYTVTPKQRSQSRSHTIEAKRARLTP
ncbi:transposase [[Micrococcus luteus] ATCC 49442]|uniref:transposase n=1 Tax=[Micrococcus luteus] ATCC 49442 TaxID=2698727 RepID=UPI0013DC2420